MNSGVPMNFVRGGSTNSVEDRGRRERGTGGGSPLVGVLEAAVIWYKKFHFIRGLLEKYPTFGREKETGLLGALDT